ncbi:MAG TPA: ribosome maturation factor RimM [Ktedonobacteraceae bacterium]|nr:ribosome maturation factor RimM [Ktedonobacteraceae bacterium]
MPKQQEIEWATIGQVVALFGVHGELKVRLLTDIPQRFQRLEVVYLSSTREPYKIERVRPYKGEMIVLKLVGIDDATTAEALRQQSLMLPLDQLAKLPPDSYYQHDILGLTVFTLSDSELGQIVDIVETGSNDVYTIKKPDGKQVMIPAIKEVVKQIDLIRRTMYIDPLPGLLEPPTRADEESEKGRNGEGEESRPGL